MKAEDVLIALNDAGDSFVQTTGKKGKYDSMKHYNDIHAASEPETENELYQITPVPQKTVQNVSEPVFLKTKNERPVLRWAGIAAACVILILSVLAGGKLLNQNSLPRTGASESIAHSVGESLPENYFLQHAEAFLYRAGFLNVDRDAFQYSVLPASSERNWNEVEIRWNSKTGPVSLRYEQTKGILLGITGMHLAEDNENHLYGEAPEQAALQFYASLTEEQKNADYRCESEQLQYENEDVYRFCFFPLSSSENLDETNCLVIWVSTSPKGIADGFLLAEDSTDVSELVEQLMKQAEQPHRDDYFHQRAVEILKQAGYTGLDHARFSVDYNFPVDFDDDSTNIVEVNFDGQGSVFLDYESGSLRSLEGFHWSASGNGPCATQEEADALATQFYETLPVPQGFSIEDCYEEKDRSGWLAYWFAQKITAEGLPDAVYGHLCVRISLNPGTGDVEFVRASGLPMDSEFTDQTVLTEEQAREIIRNELTTEQYEIKFAKSELKVRAYSIFTAKEIRPQNGSYPVARLYWTAVCVQDGESDWIFVDCYTGEFFHHHADYSD